MPSVVQDQKRDDKERGAEPKRENQERDRELKGSAEDILL